MAKGGFIRRIIPPLLIVAVLAGGLFWLDCFGVVDVKAALAAFVPRNVQKAAKVIEAVKPSAPGAGIDAERVDARTGTLGTREMEIKRREDDIKTRYEQLARMAAELEERAKSLDEREASMNALADEAASRSRNLEQFAVYLAGMPPRSAVAIIGEMNDQDAIDVMKKAEENARDGNTVSVVPFWLSLLPPERAAEIQRKMSIRP
jgi:flagellar protein FlbB